MDGKDGRRTTYTVHELAELSGVTVRTLHHYDDVGLVRAQRAANGYRLYGPAEVDRLQHALLFRECGMALADVKRLLDDPAFDARTALSGHLRELRSRRERLDGLIASVQKTLACMEGNEPMKDEEKFEAFKQGLVEENERKHGAEVRERWGDEAADASNAKVMGMNEDQWKRTQATGGADEGRAFGRHGIWATRRARTRSALPTCTGSGYAPSGRTARIPRRRTVAWRRPMWPTSASRRTTRPSRPVRRNSCATPSASTAPRRKAAFQP